MTNAKPTPGPWKYGHIGKDEFWIGPEYEQWVGCVTRDHGGNHEANARLIAESGTVHHETGLTPRQLAEQRAELLEALEKASATIGAIYQWVENVEKAGGSTNIEGISVCHAMLKSLLTQAPRVETLIMAPARAAIARARGEG